MLQTLKVKTLMTRCNFVSHLFFFYSVSWLDLNRIARITLWSNKRGIFICELWKKQVNDIWHWKLKFDIIRILRFTPVLVYSASVMEITLTNLASTFPHISWTIGIVFLILSPVTVIGNGFVLASIFCDPFKNIRNVPCSCTIFNLALVDMLVGALIEPFLAVSTFSSVINKTELISDEVITTLFFFLQAVSGGSLMFLSVDRFIAVRTPLQHACIVSKKKSRNVNILIWIYVIIFVLCSAMFGIKSLVSHILAISHLGIILLVLFVLNIAVVHSVRIQGRKLKIMVDSKNSVVIQTAFKREKAVTQTTGVMVVAFLICILPFTTFASFRFSPKEDDVAVKEILLWMYFTGLILVYLNSLMNPFLYAWRLPKYRKAFRCIFNRIKSKISPSFRSERVPSPVLKNVTIRSIEQDLATFLA